MYKIVPSQTHMKLGEAGFSPQTVDVIELFPLGIGHVSQYPNAYLNITLTHFGDQPANF